MKPKNFHGARGRAGRGKGVKKEVHLQNAVPIGPQYTNGTPSVEITKCISFQKFRYNGENRPGKKYQEKDFMELKLSNLNDRVVRIVIICTDAENKELIHPNGLVGKDCHDGIYDKEYAITRSDQDIKIPYLRTERIKTKKNENDKIQVVLETRASHLPSPYKERCLSQCNDRYTSARKFDTTKVCLGVIVTIVSHQGSFNGSLHAISHVVRNASEKTTLGILKLSQPHISATEGGTIDIFTTENGPEIEEGKYYVFVTYEDDRYGQWKSESITAGKSDILYKRIITYKVPPFVLSPNITSSVTATLNLQCPQSNQYCTYDIVYRPETVKIAEDAFEVEHSGIVKANLRSKLRAQQAGSYYEAAKDGDSGDYVRNESGIISEASRVIISPEDHAVEESPSYMGLARHERQAANGVSVIGSPDTTLMKGPGMQGSVSSSEGIEVVAAGYSADVPPDTTVYIYTTDGIPAGSLTTVPDDQVILQEIPQRQNQLLSDVPAEDVIEYMKDPKKGGFHLLTSQENTHVLNALQSKVSQIQVVASNVNESMSKTVQSSGSNGRLISSSARPFVVSSGSPGSASSDSIMRRMVVPSGKRQISPWEVDPEEHNLAAMLFSSQNNPVIQKKDYETKKPLDNMPHVLYDHSNKTPEITDADRSSQSIQVNVRMPQNEGSPLENPELYVLDSVNLPDYNLSTIEVHKIAKDMQSAERAPQSKDGVNLPDYNLSTMEVIKIVKDMQSAEPASQ